MKIDEIINDPIKKNPKKEPFPMTVHKLPRNAGRYQWVQGKGAHEYGAPPQPWWVNGQPTPEYSAWSNSEQSKAYSQDLAAHNKQQMANLQQHRQQHGKFDIELTILNPYYDGTGPDDENDPHFEPEEIDVGVDYDYSPATRQTRDDPGDDETVDIYRIVELDNGEDITNKIEGKTLDSIEQEIIEHERESAYDDYYDNYDESVESIKRLSGL